MASFELEDAIRGLISAMTQALSSASPAMTAGAPMFASAASSPQFFSAQVASLSVENIASAVVQRLASPQVASVTVENIASAVAQRMGFASAAVPSLAASPQVASVTVENIASAVAQRMAFASAAAPTFAASPQVASVTVENIASAVAARMQASAPVGYVASAAVASAVPTPVEARGPMTLTSEEDARRVASAIALNLSSWQPPRDEDVAALAKELIRFMQPAQASAPLPVRDLDFGGGETQS